jgi:cytochrome c-type biogenesis protein CcmH/NrfG
VTSARDRRGVRYPVLEVVVPVVLVAGSLVAGVMATRPDQRRASEASTIGQSRTVAPPRSQPALDALTDHQMESTLTAHPQLLEMRLALVERYLRAGQVKKAETHAHLALQQGPEPGQRPAILKYLGWSVALGGRPVQGAELLEESIRLNPDDLDARWFLGNVVFHGLGDTRRATALLEELLRFPMQASTRGVVEAKLVEARAKVASPGTPDGAAPGG